MQKKLKIAIIGASGYTGVELIRILLNHSKVEISSLIANNNAGQKILDIYPHLSPFNLPDLKKIQETNLSEIDVVFCCLPHTTSGEVIKNIANNPELKHLKIIDLSADFRIADDKNYKKWYGINHVSAKLQKNAVYGLSEINRNKIQKSNLIACPGCYPTSVLLPLVPLLENKLIDNQNIIIDSKSGVSGAGRSLKTNNLYCESNESVKAYSIANHRHIGEIEQELSLAGKCEIEVGFTPHLVPMSRGIISTIYVNIANNFTVENLKDCLRTKYEDEYFVNLVENTPSTKDVLGSNFCNIAVFESRLKNQAIIVSVIDNLVKGAAGQAVQNMNIIFNFDEKCGLNLSPLFP